VSRSKVRPLEAIGELVPDGSTVALGGSWLCNHPMAAVRQLVRAGSRDLRVLTVVGSIDIELLIGAGALGHLSFAMVSLEAFGLAPRFRRAIESASLPYTELSGLAILLGLEAQGRGVPYLPYRGPQGSDLLRVSAEHYASVTCPFTGEELTAVRAMQPDIAIVHATRCDAEGNAQWEGTSGPDIEMTKAARRVIVTCEELVSRDEIVVRSHATKVPSFLVDDVIVAPFGAHPTSHVPRYAMDAWRILDHVEAAGDEESFAQRLATLGSETEEQYRARELGDGRGDVLVGLAAQTDMLVRDRSESGT
jgi:glutaconate CoA-transferase, subunit A